MSALWFVNRNIMWFFTNIFYLIWGNYKIFHIYAVKFDDTEIFFCRENSHKRTYSLDSYWYNSDCEQCLMLYWSISVWDYIIYTYICTYTHIYILYKQGVRGQWICWNVPLYFEIYETRDSNILLWLFQ